MIKDTLYIDKKINILLVNYFIQQIKISKLSFFFAF